MSTHSRSIEHAGHVHTGHVNPVRVSYHVGTAAAARHNEARIDGISVSDPELSLNHKGRMARSLPSPQASY